MQQEWATKSLPFERDQSMALSVLLLPVLNVLFHVFGWHLVPFVFVSILVMIINLEVLYSIIIICTTDFINLMIVIHSLLSVPN